MKNTATYGERTDLLHREACERYGWTYRQGEAHVDYNGRLFVGSSYAATIRESGVRWDRSES